MQSLAKPKGPLPGRVYWTRRALLLLVVVSVVLVGARLVGGDEDAEPGRAQSVGAPAASPSARSTASPTATPSPSASSQAKPRKKKLAEPEGVCADSDVVVTPVVEQAVQYAEVAIVLELTTRSSPACTWQVDAGSVAVAVTAEVALKGGESKTVPIWSSQDCPKSVPSGSVVPRKDHPAEVVVLWSGRRSDSTCSASTGWVAPRSYDVAAVSTGATQPGETSFEVTRAVRAPKPTRTPSSKPSPTSKPSPSDG